MAGALSHPAPGPNEVMNLDVAEIYARHGQFVWMTLQRMGVAPSDLEDMCQEVFVVVYKRLDSYDPAAKMTAWLFGICLRVAAAYRRRGHRRHEQVTDPTTQGELPDQAAGPEDEVLARQRERQLHSLLDQMDLERRAVFVMFEIDGLPCAEIADLIGVPVGTVYSRLHAARKEIADIAARWKRKGEREGRA